MLIVGYKLFHYLYSHARSLPQQLKKIVSPLIHLPNGVNLSPVSSARNLGIIFDNNLSFSEHISSVSNSCFYHIRDLRRIQNTIDLTTARTIAASISPPVLT